MIYALNKLSPTIRVTIALALAVLASSCATVSPPVPETYSGPTVNLEDSGYQEDSSKAGFFVVTSIDGRPIENSLSKSRAASYGTGFTLNSRYVTRKVPVAPMKLTLVGTHQTGAPIHEIASRMAGTFFSVEGVVDFTPLEGHAYGVTGELKKERSCVWIVDAATSEPVTRKHCTP